MTILNVGSINWDRVLRVPHFPQPGETLQAFSVSVGPGGKGLNQSVAILRAGGSVRHVGAVGALDVPMRETLRRLSLDDGAVVGVEGIETGSATIFVDRAGENLIVLDWGANGRVPDGTVQAAIEAAQAGDWLLFQNETNQAASCARPARRRGLKVAYSAAPFVADTVVPLLADVDLLSVNAIELEQLLHAIGGAGNLPESLALLVTRGGEGADYIAGGSKTTVGAHAVTVVDTTGAGDVFLGAFLAETDKGADPATAMATANAAAALQVGRHGATEAIPTLADIHAFQVQHG
jgi:ribokinase